MDEEIRRERHFFFSDLSDHLVKLAILATRPVACKLGKIELLLRILDMSVEPPADGLDFGVPGIFRLVAVAIIARCSQYGLHIVRHVELGTDIVHRVAGIPGWPDKLRNDQQENYDEEHPFDYFHTMPLNKYVDPW